MKQYLYYIILIGIILLSIIGFSAWIGKLKAELVLSNNTNQSFISGNTNTEKTYTIKDFQTYQRFADSVAKANGVKTKQIIKYIKIKQIIHDSIIIPLYDTTEQINESSVNVQAFSKSGLCYNLNGFIYGDSVDIDLAYNNTIHLFTYWQWHKKGFFNRLFSWDFGKFNSALIQSECSGDTLQIIDNLQIDKR